MKRFIAVLTSLLWLSPSYGALPPDVANRVVELHITLKEKPKDQQEQKHRVAEFRSGIICSGSFIDPYGDILTAKHCTADADDIEVQTYDRRNYRGIVLAQSPVHDLAIVHIDRFGENYFHLGGSVSRGETIYVFGSPLGITDVISKGIIARLDGDVYLLDCGVLPGNSGGPVINENGELIGVATAGFIVLLGTTHLNVAQGLEAVYFFLHMAGLVR